jgi:hypothetical protein
MMIKMPWMAHISACWSLSCIVVYDSIVFFLPFRKYPKCSNDQAEIQDLSLLQYNKRPINQLVKAVHVSPYSMTNLRRNLRKCFPLMRSCPSIKLDRTTTNAKRSETNATRSHDSLLRDCNDRAKPPRSSPFQQSPRSSPFPPT